MVRRVLLAILAVLVVSLLLSFPSRAEAATITISDEVSCESAGGTWDGECKFDSTYTIDVGDVLKIEEITVLFSDLTNHGTLVLNGSAFVWVKGSFVNNILILNDNSWLVSGSFVNNNFVDINSVHGPGLRVGGEPTTNKGTINIDNGFLDILSGISFANPGTIHNYARLNNAGVINNTGVIDNHCVGILEGGGRIEGNLPINTVDAPSCGDSDGDGYDDDVDAFPNDPTEWRDNDHDGIGDNADPDDDNDGQSDADETACGSDPFDAASLSPDSNGDGRPDCLDPDSDGDGYDDDVDVFPNDPTEWADGDADGVGDNGDNCPAAANPDQADSDGDGQGDICDLDDDGDGYGDDVDAFPFDPGEWHDNDRDGIGDNADPDDDNDGQSDADETACGSDPFDAASLSPDSDGDGHPDCVDPDDGDNDGVMDGNDLFPQSDLRDEVWVGGCRARGIGNHLFATTGASFNDLIQETRARAKNKGDFVSSVAQLTNEWKKAGLISGKEKGVITNCAGRATS